MDIGPGMLVEVTTASGEHVSMRALSGPTMGKDFTIVWVCTEREFEENGAEAHRLPWPINAVRLAEVK